MKMDIYIDREFELTQESDLFGSWELVEKIEKEIEKAGRSYVVIGIFGAYGEGKSAIVKALEKRVGILEVDVWKYEVYDIENALHRIYNMEKDISTSFGNLKQSFMSIGSKSGLKSSLYGLNFTLPVPSSGLHGGYTAYQYKLHKEATRSLIDGFKKIIRYQKSVKAICFENLDRCSIEKKIELLSSVHKLQEWFDKPILIAIDPHAVDEQKKYFEDLVKKTFHTSYYVKQKTRADIDRYMDSIGGFDQILRRYILSIYSLTPRDINYILNVYRCKCGNKRGGVSEEVMKRSTALMSILHVEYRALYHHISKNPFFINRYIREAKRDIYLNLYEDFGYSDADAYRINHLLLNYYRSFESFDIFDNADAISPLLELSDCIRNFFRNFTINKECTCSSQFDTVVALLIASSNHYEVKNLFQDTIRSVSSEADLYSRCIGTILDIASDSKEMISILFVDDDYSSFVDYLKFDDKLLKQLLHISSNTYSGVVRKNLARFILSIFEKKKFDYKDYKNEFAEIFIQHKELFVSFCQVLEKNKDRLVEFINKIKSSELLDEILSSQSAIILKLYPYLLDVIKESKKKSNTEYKYFDDKLLEFFLQNSSFIHNVIDSGQFEDYLRALKHLETFDKRNYDHFRILIDIVRNYNMQATLELYAMYRIFHIVSVDTIEASFFESLVYLAVDIVLHGNDTDMHKIESILPILSSSVLMTNPEIKKHREILHEIYLKIIDSFRYTKAYREFVERASAFIFDYLNREDFDSVYKVFTFYGFGLILLKESVRNKLFYAFVEELHQKNRLDLWRTHEETLTREVLAELSNMKKDLKYLDAKTNVEILLDKLDFSWIELNELSEKVVELKEHETFKAIEKLDLYLKEDIGELELEKAILELVQRVNTKLIVQRIDYWSRCQADRARVLKDKIFELYNRYEQKEGLESLYYQVVAR